MTHKHENHGYEDLLAEAEERHERDLERYTKNPPDERSRDAMDDYAGGFLLTSLWIGQKKREQMPRETRPQRNIVPEIGDMEDARFVHACMESVTRQRAVLEHKLRIDEEVKGTRLWISSALGSVFSGKQKSKHKENAGDRKTYDALGEVLNQLQEKEAELRAMSPFRRAA